MKTLRSALLVAAAVLAGLVLVARPAGALDNPDYASDPPAVSVPPASSTPPSVLSSAHTRAAAEAPSTGSSSSGLAFTGTDTVVLVTVGGGLVLLGGLVVLVRRRSFA